MSGLFHSDARDRDLHVLLARTCAFAVLSMVCILSSAAEAHGVIGDRFFPATISSDDPFAADELALPTISGFNHETDYDFDYSKSILPGFAIEFDGGYVEERSSGGASARGFDNLDIAPTLELFRDADHEFILSAGVDWEVGGTGTKDVAEGFSTYTPTIKFGKGFGDLPDDLAYLRPLAITGTVGYAIAGAHAASRSIQWAGAVEYSLLYLQNNVQDEGFSNFVTHLTPIVEFNMTSPVDGSVDGTTGTLNPGLIWSGQHEQLAVEAILPANRGSGRSVGAIAQLHFYIDDLFPDTLGRPIFGGN
jgi:hypothetical protein